MREEGAPLARLAAEQHGVVSVRQLDLLGLHKTAVSKAVRPGGCTGWTAGCMPLATRG